MIDKAIIVLGALIALLELIRFLLQLWTNGWELLIHSRQPVNPGHAWSANSSAAVG